MLLSLLLLWPVLCQRVGERRRVLLNTALACAATFIILYATILNRTPGNYELILTPFAALSAARQQPELYRAMLMNVFLFFPLGLTLSNAAKVAPLGQNRLHDTHRLHPQRGN